MERLEIKSEDGGVVLVEYAEQNAQNSMSVEGSEDLFCKPYYQQSLDASLTEDKYCPSNTSNDQTQDEKEKAVWLDKHCKLLIAIYKEEYPKLGKTIELKTKQKMWQHIADKMREQGSYFTASQVQGKWKTLERCFTRRLATDKPCPYEKDLAALLLRHPSKKLRIQLKNMRRKEQPTAAQSPQPNPQSEAYSPMSMKSGDSLSDDESLSDSSMEYSQVEPRTGSTVVKELQLLREEFTKEMKSKRKYRHAKLRAYKRRTATLEKQNELKQRLLQTLLTSQITK